MGVIFKSSGQVLFAAGGVAMAAACCCDEGGGGGIDCGGCETGSVPAEIQLDIDGATAVENPNQPLAGVPDGCNTAACQDITGTYILTQGGAPVINGRVDPPPAPWIEDGVTFEWADTCYWQLYEEDNPNTLPCVTDTQADVMYFNLFVAIALGDDGDYYVYVYIGFCDTNSGCVGTTYRYLKNIGAVQPDCSAINELLDAHYLAKGFIFGTPIEELNDPCYYDTIEHTVSVPP